MEEKKNFERALRMRCKNYAGVVIMENIMGFPAGSVPVAVAAKVYSRNDSWVRAGIIAGWLPIGYATRDGLQVTDIAQMNSKAGKISYYISPKKLYEDTGFIWKGKEKSEKG